MGGIQWPITLLFNVYPSPFIYSMDQAGFKPGSLSERLLEFDTRSEPLGHHGRFEYQTCPVLKWFKVVHHWMVWISITLYEIWNWSAWYSDGKNKMAIILSHSLLNIGLLPQNRTIESTDFRWIQRSGIRYGYSN